MYFPLTIIAYLSFECQQLFDFELPQMVKITSLRVAGTSTVRLPKKAPKGKLPDLDSNNQGTT